MNIVEHFIFQIKHYNKVLNGNRSYVSARVQGSRGPRSLANHAVLPPIHPPSTSADPNRPS
jgi:hypothetical protein